MEDQKKSTIAAIESINIQSKELELQRKELQETREVFKEQEKTLKLQQFETSFYNLIQVLNLIINDLDFKEEKQVLKKEGYQSGTTKDPVYVSPEYDNLLDIHTGRDCFKYLYELLESTLSWYRTMDNSKSIIEIKKKFYMDYESDLTPYFRMVKQILKKIDSFNHDNQKEYAEVLIAQITKNELDLIEAFWETDIFGETYKSLLIKYKVIDK